MFPLSCQNLLLMICVSGWPVGLDVLVSNNLVQQTMHAIFPPVQLSIRQLPMYLVFVARILGMVECGGGSPHHTQCPKTPHLHGALLIICPGHVPLLCHYAHDELLLLGYSFAAQLGR
jgi:hypothetical protein